MEKNDNTDDDKANEKSREKKKFVDLGPRTRVLQILLSVAIFMRLFDLFHSICKYRDTCFHNARHLES